jgi:hypothetical protein
MSGEIVFGTTITSTITVTPPAASRMLTIPDVGVASSVFVMADGPNTFNSPVTCVEGVILGATGGMSGSEQYLGANSGSFTLGAPATIASYSALWPAAQASTSALMRNDGFGNLSWGGFGAASIKNSTNQSISSGASTLVILDTVGAPATNTDLTTSTGTSAITVNVAGTYQITARINWFGSPPAGLYQLNLLVNGAATDEITWGVPTVGALGSVATGNGQTITSVLTLAAASTVTVQASQNSGSAVSIYGTGVGAAHLYITRIA